MSKTEVNNESYDDTNGRKNKQKLSQIQTTWSRNTQNQVQKRFQTNS